MTKKTSTKLLIGSGVVILGVLMFTFLYSPDVEVIPESVANIPMEEIPLDVPEPIVEPVEPLEPVEAAEEEPLMAAPSEEASSTPQTGGLIEVEWILLGLGATSFGTGFTVLKRRRK